MTEEFQNKELTPEPTNKLTNKRTRKIIIGVVIGVVLFFLIIGVGSFFLIHYFSEITSVHEPDQNLIKVSLEGIRIDTKTNMPVILLKEEDGDRYLPIWIGPPEALAITLELSQTKTPRPMTHDLIINIFKALDITVRNVIISDIKENTFYAIITMEDKDGKLVKIDSRPSDAIAIAVRVNCEIFVTEDILDSKGVKTEQRKI